MCTVIYHRRHHSDCKEQKCMTQDEDSWVVWHCSLHAVTSYVIYYITHTRIFVLYNKNSNGLLKDLWGMKKEKHVHWRDLMWIWCHLCECPLIGHIQQSMKMHTEVTLYNSVSLVSLQCYWHCAFFLFFIFLCQYSVVNTTSNSSNGTW